MFRRVTPGWLARAALVGGLLAAAGLGAPARAQTQNPTPAVPKFALTVAATEPADAKAFEAAKGYFADVKAGKDKDTAKQEEDAARTGAPPGYPAAAAAGGAASTADLVAAATLPPFGLAERAAAEQMMAAKSSAARYRWAKVSGPRELYALGLDETAKTDRDRKAVYDGAAAARKAKEVYVHPDLKWAIYSRDAAAGGVDYFILVLQPEGQSLVTEADLMSVRRTNEGLTVNLTPVSGAARLKEFTTQYKSGDKQLRFVVATFGDEVADIAALGNNVIATGQIKLGAGRPAAFVDQLFTRLD